MSCFILYLLATLVACSWTAPPTVASLAGEWLTTERGLVDMPVVSNFWGSVGTNNDDMLSVNSMLISPFVQGTDLLSFFVDGERVHSQSHRWSAYEASRHATSNTGVLIDSRVRLAFESPALLLEVSMKAPTSSKHSVIVNVTPLVRQATDLPWVTAYPNVTSEFIFSADANGIFGQDKKSSAQTVFGIVGDWCRSAVSAHGGVMECPVELHAELTTTWQFLFAVGNATWPSSSSGIGVRNYFDGLLEAQTFAQAWDTAATLWEKRWLDAFSPNNGHFSGWLPSLQGEASLERIYYNSLLTAVALERTNLPLVSPRVYLTSAGNALPYNCSTCLPRINGVLEVGGAGLYYWDLVQLAGAMTLLDPIAIRDFLKFVLSYPPNSKGQYAYEASNGVDAFTGNLFGAWYSFNAYSLFGIIRAYIATSGDQEFLDVSLAGRSVRGWLEVLATDWHRYNMSSIGEPSLADYGGFAGDFLECVPTYVHAVAALQAHNIWMSRELAGLMESEGHLDRAIDLKATAKSIAGATTRRLYVKGGGFFGTLSTTNQTRVSVRTIVDFQAVGHHMILNDLGSVKRYEMASFFHLELEQPRAGWPIALSRRDLAAPVDRTDHGTDGAYGAWPGLAFEALASLEHSFGTATDFLLGSVRAARQGPYGQSQAIRSTGHNNFKPVIGVNRYIAISGGAFAEAILRTLFGYRPSLATAGKDLQGLWLPEVDRHLLASLHGLRLGDGTVVSLEAGAFGVRLLKPEPFLV